MAEPSCMDAAIGEVHEPHAYTWQGYVDGETTMVVAWCEGVTA